MTLTMTNRTMLVTAVALLALGLSLLALPRPAHASTTFTVNQITDVSDENLSDSLCDINSSVAGDQCTLRAAIQEANDTPGADTILFNLFGTGVMTIHVGSTTPSLGDLPQITEAVTIDGYSQYGASENTLKKGTNAKPMIELDGSALNGQIAMGLDIDAPNVVIKGLVINRFPYDGILLNSSATSCKVEGNFIGTDPSGTIDLGNTGAGVLIGSTAGHDTVRGASPAARNLISGNDSSGVAIDDDSSTNEVLGNLIGTKKDGKSPLGNS